MLHLVTAAAAVGSWSVYVPFALWEQKSLVLDLSGVQLMKS